MRLDAPSIWDGRTEGSMGKWKIYDDGCPVSARCKVRSDEGIDGTDQRWRTTNRANPGRVSRAGLDVYYAVIRDA